ncbi:hypothetical protein LAZ67_18000559 [Cordylochernes scorpioides]|uniref:HTH psq-type domain-containing protein n=1 Tax=Cordylochernes scorpioides TaxID=51811 RepID=A0ABY6LEY1_9ARAC|nr:hypothetical protein LAZ67_18000559 [Cordylochernes scorpioides]
MDRKKVCKKSSAKKNMMSIELKREIIEKHEQGVRVVDMSRQYGRSTSMICSVLKRKESINSVTPAKGLMIISKLRTSLHENMEKLLMVWVTEKQLQGDTLTQTIICEKAKAIYGDLLKQTPQTSIDEASEDMQVIGFEESEEEVISTSDSRSQALEKELQENPSKSEDNSSKSEENLSRSEDNPSKSEEIPNTQGLLRVGGRLKYSYLNENQNFPLLQPKPPRQESLIKNLLTENADIPEAIDENQEDSSILETTFVIEDEESNKDIGTPKIEISEVSVIDKSEGKYSKEPVVSVEALDKKELCHDDSAHLNVVEADLNRPKEATSGIINVSTEVNESASKEKAVSVEIVDTSTKDYLQSGEKAKLSRWKPIDSLCLEDVKESEDDDENYSSSAYIEWLEILKKEVLRPEALEKAVNLEDFEKAAESRQLSKEHLEESTEKGSCIKAESKTWEDPIESDLAAAESDNPAVPERELANESQNLIQDSPQSDTQRWKLIPLPFKQ